MNERAEEVNERSLEVNELVVEVNDRAEEEIGVIERGQRMKSIIEFEEEIC